MKYRAIVEAFNGQPLAILPAKLAEVRHFLRAKAAGEDVAPEEVARVVAGRRELALADASQVVRRPDGAQQIGRVAVMTVFGVLAQRMNLMSQMSGGTSTERVGATLDSLVADRSVKCVVMCFDSPGGSVFGVGELGDKIRAARDEKKIIGIADSMAASAAYWCLAQCGEVYCTPGGQVGSIGVLTAHEDYSKADEEEGVKTTLVYAGKYKVEGNPYEPLGEEARAELQAKVDGYYSAFVGAVAKGRGVSEGRVRADFGGGRMMLADQAVSAGLCDRVGTLATLLKRCDAYDGPSAADQAPGVSAHLAALRARAAEAE